MKQAIGIGTVVGVQLLATLLSQLLVIRIVGLGPDTDAYIAAQTVPAVIVAIITNSLQSVWLPRLAVITGDLFAWRQEQSIAQGQAALLGGGLLLIVGGSSPFWLPQLFPGFDALQKKAAIFYCLVLLTAAVFNTQSAILTVALRARNRFMAAEIIALIGTVLSLATMYLTLPHWGLTAAVWIGLARSIFVYGVQMSLANWPPMSIERGWSCKETWISMRPLLFGASIYKTSPLVDRYWASQSQAGSITTLSLAQTAIGALATVLERAISMPITTTLARYVAQNDYGSLQNIYRRALINITVVILSVGLLLTIFKSIIVSMVSSMLLIDFESAYNFWIICMILVGYLHAAISGVVLVSAFYALGDTKTPVYIGLFGFSLGLFLKYALFKVMGINGLALSASIYFLINILVFYIFLERKVSFQKAMQ